MKGLQGLKNVRSFMVKVSLTLRDILNIILFNVWKYQCEIEKKWNDFLPLINLRVLMSLHIIQEATRNCNYPL